MIHHSSIIDLQKKISPDIKHLVDLFISPEGVGRRYLFGRNEHSEALLKVIDIDGFVDDYAEQGTIWHGKPVVNSSNVPKQAIVVNCSMCNMPVTAINKIKNLNVSGGLAYSDLNLSLPDLIPLPNFVADTRADFQQNHSKWEALSSALADDQSRRVLDDILSFRLTGDCKSMASYSFRPREQYFENFLGLGTMDVFVDAGGYDGDTTEEFCRRYPGYKKVYLFEPSSSNLNKAQARLKDFRDIEFIQLGLSDAEGKLQFNADGGSASCISSSGSCQINVTTLDQYVNDKVTFIKMDLEGWELKAMQGAKKHIIEDKPKLAIAVYHNASDFWQVFEYVTSLRRDYRVFLRHYTEGWSETVMYCVP
ncbi:MAG: FkbM family methyltransferase [Smithella sp.]|nr:FkbM family methyltransferase [Smithella sp.]